MLAVQDSSKAVEKVGSATGFLSLLGSYTICHNLCMAAVAVLAVVGITFSGLPFLFLLDYAVYFWGMAVLALAVALFLYFKMGHKQQTTLLLVNAGFVIAGIPFGFLRAYELVFQVVGGLIVAYAVGRFVVERFRKKRNGKKR